MRGVRENVLGLLRRAAWAPAAVIIFHAIVASTPYRQALDFPVHFLGGAAAAYFFYHAFGFAGDLLGKPTRLGRFVFAYALACTVGVFWEIAEFAAGLWLGANIQLTMAETMWDLVADVSGALLALALVRVFGRAE